MIRSFIRKIGRFGRDDKGTAAVEFAMTVP